MDLDDEWNNDEIDSFDFFNDDHKIEKPAKFEEQEFREPSPISVEQDTNSDVEINFKPKAYCTFCCQIVAENNLFCYDGKKVFCNRNCLDDFIRKIYQKFLGGKDESILRSLSSVESFKFLLSLACQDHDSDVMIHVLKSLMKRLDRMKFYRILRENKQAYHNFLGYILYKDDQEEIDNFMRVFKQEPNTVLMKLSKLFQKLHLEDTEASLQNIIVFAHTQLTGPSYEAFGSYVMEYAELYRYQKEFNSKWSAFIKSLEYQEMLMKYPDRMDTECLIGLSLAETIDNITLLENNIDPGSTSAKLKVQFSLQEDQYTWIVLEPLIMRENWMALDEILFAKNIFMRKTTTVSLTPDRLVLKLHTLKVPIEYLKKCLRSIDNVYIMVDICLRLCLYQFIYEHLLQIKTYEGMEYLSQQMPRNIPEYDKVMEYIKSNKKIWNISL